MLSVYVGGVCEQMFNLAHFNINWYPLQLVVGHTVIIVGYIIRVGTSLSLLAHGGFVGEQPHEAEMEILPDPGFRKPQLT